MPDGRRLDIERHYRPKFISIEICSAGRRTPSRHPYGPRDPPEKPRELPDSQAPELILDHLPEW